MKNLVDEGYAAEVHGKPAGAAGQPIDDDRERSGQRATVACRSAPLRTLR